MTFLTSRKFAQLTAALLATMLAMPALAAPNGTTTTTSTSISGQFKNSFATDLKLAQQGDALAQNNVGARYLNGVDGVAKDYAQAKMWLEKAVAQGLQLHKTIWAICIGKAGA